MDWKSKRVRAIVDAALLEDKAVADISTALTIDPDARGTGTIVAHESCIVAGLGIIPVVLETFAQLTMQQHIRLGVAPLGRFEVVSHPEVFDGARVRRGQPLAVVRHTAAAILATERTVLNLLSRMCGIATLTNEYVRAVEGTGADVLDTRKTLPGLRLLDHFAVCCGGGLNHRQDLGDGVLLKSNHLVVGGGLASTVGRALQRRQPGQKIQVEIRTLAELDEALASGVDAILLDNMTPDAVRDAVRRIRAVMPSMPIEASGGISLGNARSYAEAGVNYVTVGSLTHSARSTDLTLRLTRDAS